jgi:hypothetical protein
MPKRYLDGILAGWMLVSVGTVVAEDNPPAAPPKVEAEAARAKSPESDPRLPPIPLQVLTALASNTTTGSFVLGQAYDLTAVCRELEITDAQRADMSKLMQPHHRWNLSLQKARQVFFEGPQIGFGGASQALTMAFELLEQRESRRLAASLEAPLTPAQRAGLRRKFRGAGSDELVRRNTPKHLHSSMDSGRVEAFTRAGDQLSLLLVGSVQDQLELTDEQFLALCDVRDRAVVAAIQLIEAEMALAEQTTPPATVFGSTTLGGIFADAVKELSDEQRQTFGKFFENPAPERMRELMRGGATRIQQVNDQVQAEVTIPNPVENSEELRQALNLTDEQRKKFAAAIKVEEEKVKQRIIDNARNQFIANKQTSARGAEIRKAFFDEWNREALALLTPEQLAKLGNQKWRARGIMSLLDPELGQQLELTERQQADIRKLLVENRPVEVAFQPFQQPGEKADDFLKRQEKERLERQKQAETHIANQKAVLEILTDEQRAKFVERTGYKAPIGPTTPRPRIPAANPAMP